MFIKTNKHLAKSKQKNTNNANEEPKLVLFNIDLRVEKDKT